MSFKINVTSQRKCCPDSRSQPDILSMESGAGAARWVAKEIRLKQHFRHFPVFPYVFVLFFLQSLVGLQVANCAELRGAGVFRVFSSL